MRRKDKRKKKEKGVLIDFNISVTDKDSVLSKEF